MSRLIVLNTFTEPDGYISLLLSSASIGLIPDLLISLKRDFNAEQDAQGKKWNFTIYIFKGEVFSKTFFF